jgi:cation:H+ antiporter
VLPALLALVVGLALLVWSADPFVDGAAATAAHLGMPPLLIGMVIVGFGTSAPEILVSAVAASSGVPGLAIGNALGSNIANIGLVLGVAVLIRPLTASSILLRRELPVLLAATFLPALLYVDGQLSRPDAGVLILSLFLLVYWLVVTSASAATTNPIGLENSAESPQIEPLAKTATWLVIGLTALLVGAQLIVFGAEQAARTLGISEVVIGLTVVAIGTSLPELAVAVTGAVKNEPDLVIGNVIGSNIFNILGVIGTAGLIAPYRFETEILTVHYPVMAVMTLAVFILTYNLRKHRGELGRMSGFVLLLSFVIYQIAVAWLAMSV